MNNATLSPIGSARWVVVEALTQAAGRWPKLTPNPPDGSCFTVQDAKLALAIHGCVLRRWITLEFLIQRNLRQPFAGLEPAIKATLLSGAAQLLFMDRLPIYAVIDESVKIARKRVRPGAAGLVNAVLRRLSEMIGQTSHGVAWSPAVDVLPTQSGVVRLQQPCLPDPADLVSHLHVATSHPRNLVQRWLQNYGAKQTIQLCRHDTQTPPVILAVPNPKELVGHDAFVRPHSQPGFFVWTGTHGQLTDFLAMCPPCRVQDPTSAKPLAATADRLNPGTILDYCAGRGTKTRQLASLYPQSRILATEIDPQRYEMLLKSCCTIPNVQVLPAQAVGSSPWAGHFELVLVDAPCSNTAVLARRPEARYRLNPSSLRSLVNVQRRILTTVLPWIRPGGHVLHSTCSLEPEENQNQARWLQRTFGLQPVSQEITLPGGGQTTYHDGGYYALMLKPA